MQFELPKTNRLEELETISRHKFALLLDPKQFEVRAESERDKGVDFTVELKRNGEHTNYRFAVQIKSTEKFGQKSKSKALKVSNILYLENYGMPSYYILYDH